MCRVHCDIEVYFVWLRRIHSHQLHVCTGQSGGRAGEKPEHHWQTCRAVRHDMEWRQQCRDMSMKARVLGSPGERDVDPGLGVRDWGPWLAGRERLGTLGASSGNSGGS